MGDGADHLNEIMEAQVEYDPESDEGPFPAPRANKVCKSCKKGGLHWETVMGKWRLFDGPFIHKCPVKPL